MSNQLITDITKDIFLVLHSPLLNFLDIRFREKDFDYKNVGSETYQNICKETNILFGPDDYLINTNKKTFDFFKGLLEKYEHETNDIILKEMSEVKYKNRYYYDNFVYLVKLFNIFKKHLHPIYCVLDFLRLYPFEDTKSIIIGNIINVLLEIVNLENKRKRLKNYYLKFGIFHKLH